MIDQTTGDLNVNTDLQFGKILTVLLKITNIIKIIIINYIISAKKINKLVPIINNVKF